MVTPLNITLLAPKRNDQPRSYTTVIKACVIFTYINYFTPTHFLFGRSVDKK